MKKEQGYTLEEIEELKQWFEVHMEEIPESMQIEAGVFTPDLQSTINMLLEQAYICYNNPKMKGCILLLKKIQQNILKINN